VVIELNQVLNQRFELRYHATQIVLLCLAMAVLWHKPKSLRNYRACRQVSQLDACAGQNFRRLFQSAVTSLPPSGLSWALPLGTLVTQCDKPLCSVSRVCFEPSTSVPRAGWGRQRPLLGCLGFKEICAQVDALACEFMAGQGTQLVQRLTYVTNLKVKQDTYYATIIT
jgi:hypothetical protein